MRKLGLGNKGTVTHSKYISTFMVSQISPIFCHIVSINRSLIEGPETFCIGNYLVLQLLQCYKCFKPMDLLLFGFIFCSQLGN